MSEELMHLRASLAQLASETRRRQGSRHPPPDALAAYAAGELQPPAAEGLLEHLAVCRTCARLLLGLPAFLAATGEEPEPRTRPLRRRAVLALAARAAACLAAILIGLFLWTAAPGRSRVPPPIVPVNPPEQTLGETPAPGAPPTALRLDAEAAALVLYLRGPQASPSLRVEVLDRAGRARVPAAAAAVGPQAVLVLLTRRQLPAGDYRLRVFGVEAHRQRPLGDYPLRILAR